jgi:hypothetical protein
MYYILTKSLSLQGIIYNCYDIQKKKKKKKKKNNMNYHHMSNKVRKQ